MLDKPILRIYSGLTLRSERSTWEPTAIPCGEACSNALSMSCDLDRRAHAAQTTRKTHLGYRMRHTLGLSASWNNSLSSAASLVNSRCLSFLSVHTSAFGVFLASQRVTHGAEESSAALENAEGEVDGDAEPLEGEGR